MKTVSILIWFLFIMLEQTAGQRRPKWDECNCHWGTWKNWDDCSKLCYGRQGRERAVWRYDTPECKDISEVCDENDGYFEHRDCNTYCTFGNVAGTFYKYCQCPPGRYGVCCDQVVTCGAPQPLHHGHVDGSNYTFGAQLRFSCDPDFNLTGSAVRTCQKSYFDSVGTWSGLNPHCWFVQSCRSSPCQNGGTCQNGLDTYTCLCLQGWSGTNCEIDIQPPVVDQCPGNATVHTGQRQVPVTWRPPSFSDPHNFSVVVTSNYQGSSFTFPWGDFVIQYSAVKPSNGLRTDCVFGRRIRPFPCPPLPPPGQGMLVCNGWREDFGRYCLTTCLKGFVHPRGTDPTDWHVCGASGHWSAGATAFDCEDDPLAIPDTFLPQPKDCSDTGTLAMVRDKYIRALNSSNVGGVCRQFPDLCRPDNVKILCNGTSTV